MILFFEKLVTESQYYKGNIALSLQVNSQCFRVAWREWIWTWAAWQLLCWSKLKLFLTWY